jgi:hypothetical protein
LGRVYIDDRENGTVKLLLMRTLDLDNLVLELLHFHFHYSYAIIDIGPPFIIASLIAVFPLAALFVAPPS